MILPRMKKGASWVEMSTLGRDEVLTLAAVAAEAGVRMLEEAREVEAAILRLADRIMGRLLKPLGV